MGAPGSTLFPLLQTVVVATSASNGPDIATMTGGATLILDLAASKATFNVANSALQVSNAPLIKQPQTVYYEPSGSTVIRVNLSALDWTGFGTWDVYPGGVTTTRYHSNFVTGFQTPGAAVPTSGSASYTGRTFGEVYPGGYSGFGEILGGDVSLVANFADQTINGALTNMMAGDPWWTGDEPWNSVSLSASFSGGQSRFAGTTAVTNAPGNSLSLKAGATGTVVGSFFGPHAEEIGAVWTLSDGVGSAVGSIGAKRAP